MRPGPAAREGAAGRALGDTGRRAAPPGPAAGGPSCYAWYGSPRFAGRYRHRDPRLPAGAPRGRLRPPGAIGSSSRPPDEHTGRLRAAAATGSESPGPGPPRRQGGASDSLVPSILDAAHSYAIKVAFHGQPYKGHDDHAVHENIKYITDRYRSHPAFYKYKTSTGKSLPLFYIYDSYLTPAESWASLLRPSGSHSLRNTAYNAVLIALLVEEEGHKHDILSTGYDGTYTYFASNGFSFGSSHQNWKAIKTFWDSNNLMFIPSVGPGYIDTSIRPWNNHNTRNRVSGKYYETALQAALMVRPEIVSITSFSEWHEGTQIEKAVPKMTLTHLYLGYLPHQPSMYLELTHRWAEHFSKERAVVDVTSGFALLGKTSR
ncbi:LOW QUALITY PROTEIN: glycoprotein endo-alpha-1,2-mannosidase-like protein [Ciconia boyciana]|uniref:LOW QUALITY PROTEIN: glycoprotein endo-alpha-1,2-mannosidase-like protein n=1 Tax=Ciconia boyciana TaxID=52775 RepID=UPI003BA30498